MIFDGQVLPASRNCRHCTLRKKIVVVWAHCAARSFLSEICRSFDASQEVNNRMKLDMFAIHARCNSEAVNIWIFEFLSCCLNILDVRTRYVYVMMS